ncbi:general transcription factor II-I repeat domain-containing protein 2A [Trichonephila clavipes]|nr:general transcription factor II-I repeat domain-containing protein 2A [Trichonephila clavipes]
MATLPDCSVRWLTYGNPKIVRKLGEQGNKAVLGWVMKEGLIPSRYECQKCKKDMLLVERKDKTIQRIKDVPLSRNTMKDRILKLAENGAVQQKNDINSALFISLCLDESIDITKSAHLAVFPRYRVGNIIKEELIAITSLLTTTKGTDICTAVRNSLAEKEIDLKKIVSVTTDGAPNMDFADAQKKHVLCCIRNSHLRHAAFAFLLGNQTSALTTHSMIISWIFLSGH